MTNDPPMTHQGMPKSEFRMTSSAALLCDCHRLETAVENRSLINNC